MVVAAWRPMPGIDSSKDRSAASEVEAATRSSA
jgi:hypothetical protein